MSELCYGSSQSFKNVFAVAAIKVQLLLSSNDAKKREGTITSCVGIVNRRLRRFETDHVIAKADEEFFNCRQGLLTLCDFSLNYGPNVRVWWRV